jgi:hypothetical protein
VSARPDLQLIPVFEFRPGRKLHSGRAWGRRWLCFACVFPAWQAGQYTDPCLIPRVDLEGVLCLFCEKPVVNGADGPKNEGGV